MRVSAADRQSRKRRDRSDLSYLSFDFFGVPAWIKSGGVVAVGTNAAQVDYDFAKEPRLLPGSDPFEVQLPWATSVSDVKGARVIANDAPRKRGPTTDKGVILAVSDGEVSVQWAR